MADMPKLMLLPLRDGYGFNLGRDVVTTETTGGMPRQRRDGVGKVHRASTSYRCNKAQWQYLSAFLRAYAGLPFLAFLQLDDADCGWYESRIISDNIGGGVVGAGYVDVSLELVAKPKPYDVDTDITLTTIYQMTDGQIDLYFRQLEKLVNEDLPNAIGGL